MVVCIRRRQLRRINIRSWIRDSPSSTSWTRVSGHHATDSPSSCVSDTRCRVLDFEMAALSGDWLCNSSSSSTPVQEDEACEHRALLEGGCFAGDCRFLVSHGDLRDSVTFELGYTYPEALFRNVAQWLEKNPTEIVSAYSRQRLFVKCVTPAFSPVGHPVPHSHAQQHDAISRGHPCKDEPDRPAAVGVER